MSYWTAGKRLSADAFAKYMQAGNASVSFTSKTSFTQEVTFPVAFDAVPAATVNIASGAGATAQWVGRAINVTATGFTLFVFSGTSTSATWSDITVYWMAVAR